MRQSAVYNWFDSEIGTFLSNSSLVNLTSPADHVGMTEGRESVEYPFIGIRELATVPESGGLGNGELTVDSINYDNNDILQSVDYKRETTLRVELVPTTDGDAKLRDDLAEDLTDHFALLQRNGSTPSDLTITKVEEQSPQGRADEWVRADGVPIEVEYERYLTDDTIQAAEQVNVDVDAQDDDAISGSV